MHILHNNTPKYVLLREKDYKSLAMLAFEQETLKSEAEIKKGNFKKGSPKDLLKVLGI